MKEGESMAGGKRREPIDLIIAKGKKHLTQKEIDERRAQELTVPFKNVEPPKCLTTKKQKEEFREIADKLLELDIFTELDVDALARYIISRELYLKYTKELNALLKEKYIQWGAVKFIQQLQDKAFRQCTSSANELCLNISSRAKLVIPTSTDDEDDEL